MAPYERFSVIARKGNITCRPCFTAPKDKYPLEIRQFLGVSLWRLGDFKYLGTKGLNIPKIGVVLKVSETQTRVLWLMCSVDFIDTAISNLPGLHLYHQTILDAFLEPYFQVTP